VTARLRKSLEMEFKFINISVLHSSFQKPTFRCHDATSRTCVSVQVSRVWQNLASVLGLFNTH
jgi:hypothetical protein